MARSGAKGLAIATLLLDLGKAFVAVKIAQHIAPANYDLAVAAAVAALLGHCFPIWLGFRGGKGVASALGVFLALTPISALALLIIFLIIFCVYPLRIAGFDRRRSGLSDLRLPLCAVSNADRHRGLPLYPFAHHRQAPPEYPSTALRQ